MLGPTCTRCGRSFVPREPAQSFCSAACRYHDQFRPAVGAETRHRASPEGTRRPDGIFVDGVVDVMLTCPACLAVYRHVGALRGDQACTECARGHLVPADGFVDQALRTAAEQVAAQREQLARRIGRYRALGHSRGLRAVTAIVLLVAVVLLVDARGAPRSTEAAWGNILCAVGLVTLLIAGAARRCSSKVHARRALEQWSLRQRFNPYRLDTGLGRYVAVQLRAHDNLGHPLSASEAMEALVAWDRREVAAQQARFQNLLLLEGLVALQQLHAVDRHQQRQ